MVISNNVEGHNQRYEELKRTMAPDQLGPKYVGGGDVYKIGFFEKEIISRHTPLDLAYVVDLGCGVGRLTRYMLAENLSGYLGTDVVPEILEDARALTNGDERFRFEAVNSCAIPLEDGKADIVCAFSVITHLLDEEIFDYFREASRVLKTGGNFVVSFLDFSHHKHRNQFLAFAGDHKSRLDVLKFIEKSTLEFFAASSGLEVIEFIDATIMMRPKSSASNLLNGEPAPTEFQFGQSIVWLRKT